MRLVLISGRAACGDKTLAGLTMLCIRTETVVEYMLQRVNTSTIPLQYLIKFLTMRIN